MLNKLFTAVGMLFNGLVSCCRLANFVLSEELRNCWGTAYVYFFNF